MSAAIKALARRIRLALHRHDRIECWRELTVDHHRAAIAALPVVIGPGPCDECWTNPGEKHQLSCSQVSFEQFKAFDGGTR